MKVGYYWYLDSHFAFPLFLDKGNKTYFLASQNKDQSFLKIITSISKARMGEVIIKAMPIKEE